MLSLSTWHDGDVSYHHGNLRESLLAAAVELVAKDGPDAVSLREVARHVGVSHNAAYRHFVDREELMRAAAARALTGFGEYMAACIRAVGDDDGIEPAYDRLAACGRAYVEFAVDNPGLFRMICAFPLGEIAPDSDVMHPYAQLSAQLDELVTVGAVTAERRANAEIAAVSAVHGFAVWTTDGPWRTASAPERDAGWAQLVRIVRHGI